MYVMLDACKTTMMTSTISEMLMIVLVCVHSCTRSVLYTSESDPLPKAGDSAVRQA